MKITVGHAKNVSFELIVGNLLIGIGGFLIGLVFLDSSLFLVIIPAFITFSFGIIFDVRVLMKFAFDLKEVWEGIDSAREGLIHTISEVDEHKKELTTVKAEIRKTISELQTSKKELEQLESDIYPRNTVTNPNLLIRRFESIENYTMFNIDKQPILQLYQKLVSDNPNANFKSVQDMKLIKLFSLVYNLMLFNNALLYYKGNKINFEPLINLMNKKNRYNQLCKLKVYEYAGEIDFNLENKIGNLVALCYNSMIDSQDIGIMVGDPEMVVKEHFIKVADINEKFKELFVEVNDFLSVKFPDDQCKAISNLQYNI